MITDKSTFVPRVCYEIFVRSFCDTNGDGIGDLQGIISKLDYLQDLGIEAIWLTPIHPSPSYHKYDVIDYFDIEPEYGTLEDFKNLLEGAHSRGIAIYLDLIINHTSTLHPWFKEARKGPHSRYRDYYWWMTPPQIEALGIKERETSDDSQVVYPWHDNFDDPEKYYGMFFKGMPDLNFHSDALREEIAEIMRFWLIEVGVDGFRLDAARHIYPDWEKENNTEFWEFFARKIKEIKPAAFTVGEVWAETEEVAPYFRHLDATFHFDLSFALQRILIQERDENLIEKLTRSYALFEKFNPLYIDAIMLTNHDQERIGSVVFNVEAKMKLAAAILLTLPGQPYIYYGEEIGMLGSKPDPYIREPFLWDENPGEKSNWINAQFSTLQTVKPLSVQENDTNSVFQHYRTLIHLRKSEPALSQMFAPNLLPVDFKDDGIFAYFRSHVDKSVLVIHNLTGSAKDISLPADKSDFRNILFSTNEEQQICWNENQLLPYSTLILSLATS